MAEIIRREHIDPVTGGVWYTYEWDGPENEPVKLNHVSQRQLHDLPWKLEKIKDDIFYGIYVRNDTAFPWYALHRLKQAWRSTEWLKVRIIATLVIWGVGYIESGQIIDWRCLKQKNPFSR